MTATESSAMLSDGTKIIAGGGSGSALHGMWQRAHRQKRQERVWPLTVPLPGVWSVPGVASQGPGDRAPERQDEVLHAVAIERLSLRAAERIFGVDRHTISRWLEKKPETARR